MLPQSIHFLSRTVNKDRAFKPGYSMTNGLGKLNSTARCGKPKTESDPGSDPAKLPAKLN